MTNLVRLTSLFALAAFASRAAAAVFPGSQSVKLAGIGSLEIDPRIELLSGIQSRTEWVGSKGYGPDGEPGSYYGELKELFAKAEGDEAVGLTKKLLEERDFSCDAPIAFALSLEDGWKLAAPRSGWSDYVAKRAGGVSELEALRAAYAAAANDARMESFYNSHRREYREWLSEEAKAFGRGKLAKALALMPPGQAKLHIVLAPAMFKCGYSADLPRSGGGRDCYVVFCGLRRAGASIDFGGDDYTAPFCAQAYAKSLAAGALAPARVEAAKGFASLYAFAATSCSDDVGPSPSIFLENIVASALAVDVARRAGLVSPEYLAAAVDKLRYGGLFPIDEALAVIGEAGGGRGWTIAKLSELVLERLDTRSSILAAKAKAEGMLPLPESELRAAVRRDASTFGSGSVPDGLRQAIAGKSLVFLGEAHYRLEHQRFICDLFPILKADGIRVIANEMSSAYEPQADAYASGQSEDLPQSIRMFDGTWLDALRAFNSRLPAVERIRVRYFDMNHDEGAYQAALDFLVQSSGSKALREASSAVMRCGPRDSGYLSALKDLESLMTASPPSGLSPVMAGQIASMTETEIRSYQVRRQWSDAARESIIIDRCSAILAEAPGRKLVVNTGSYHAQRVLVQRVGDATQTVASYFQAHPELYGGLDKLYSVAFDALRGKQLNHFYDQETSSFDHYAGRAQGLFKAIGDLSEGAKSCFLPLEAPEFSRSIDKLGDGQDCVRLHPSYDALIVYPSATIIPTLGPKR
jgi:Erythromycin esterase homolog